jgi:hypothetical protein
MVLCAQGYGVVCPIFLTVHSTVLMYKGARSPVTGRYSPYETSGTDMSELRLWVPVKMVSETTMDTGDAWCATSFTTSNENSYNVPAPIGFDSEMSLTTRVPDCVHPAMVWRVESAGICVNVTFPSGVEVPCKPVS